ncbi:hypothetical protein ACIBXA_00500 [Micromonospora echinaurantiaca]|uniref:hypothetical protein n=1 Tax=Micromonospora TaxID=1873 RepID=UPI000D6FC75F|nr:hypothetical protein [Micromonospora sp. S4605]PWU51492.1 hypothetical protein DLJ47_21320 [Micromonospora sp. S4605]
MTRSIRGSRRAALVLSGVAAATGLLLSGCGAGQVSETANKEPSVQGVNLSTSNGEYAVRGLLVEFPGIEGYQAGANALLSAVIYNDSRNPVTVTVSSQDARDVVITGDGAAASPSATPTQEASPTATPSATPTGTASPTGTATPTGTASPFVPPSPSATPSVPAGGPARIEIPPLSYVQLNSEANRILQLIGLNEAVRSGQNVFVTFDFGNGISLTGPAPVAVPLTPAAPPSPIIEREGGYEGQEDGGGHGGSDH